MPEVNTNFSVSTVATAPSPATSGTSLVVASGHGTRFPNPATANFSAIVCPAAQQPTIDNAEIVRVTAKSTDTLTITRAQEGTSARSIVVGDRIYAGLTAGTFYDKADIDAANFVNAANAVQKATIDAKGDILAGTANDAVDNLTVGSNKTGLVADSSQSTGLRWGAPIAGTGAYTTIALSNMNIGASQASGNQAFAASATPFASGGSAGGPPAIYIDNNELDLAGLTTQLRVKMILFPNATAPAINFTAGLSEITAVAGGANVTTYTFSAQIAGTTVTRTTPSASTRYVDTSADFNVPADGWYFLTCTLSGSLAATNPHVTGVLYLQMRHV